MSPAEQVPAREAKSWDDWYEFALDELELGQKECVDYANRRLVEVENRRLLDLLPARDDR